MSSVREYAVFRKPGNILVGIEPDGFNVVKLGKEYGAGTYSIAVFEDGREVRRYHQVVDDRLGPPKKTDPISDPLPGELRALE